MRPTKFLGALPNRKLDQVAAAEWERTFGRRPNPHEELALARLARVVEGLVRNQAQAYGLELADRADVLEVEASIGEPSSEEAREVRLASDLFRAFGRFARDPLNSSSRARAARDRARRPEARAFRLLREARSSSRSNP